jgi:superfamily II DNA/RNA helicase
MSLEPQLNESLLSEEVAISAEAPVNGFADLGLAKELLSAVERSGYTTPTEVQSRAIPAAMAGQDLLVSSKTGSGKTAAFVLPALERIQAARGDASKRRAKGAPNGPRVLVLAPTRELAMQVSKAVQTYGVGMQGLKVACVVGGVPYPLQLRALRGPLDVLIATPGRLLDHLQSGVAVLDQVEMFVLDEADRMLDMGFIDDINTIAAALPAQRQTLMFSATFAGHVGRLAANLTRDPQRIEVASHTDAHAQIEQRLHWADDLKHKNAMLEQLLADRELDQAVVFCSTQRDADVLADRLADIGHSVAALHGGMPQGRRNRVLQGLRQRQLRVLVATDVAARGIDVPTITHVINYGLPMKPEDYIHRIGRTGRAGRDGIAVTLAERRDVGMIRRIERFTTQNIAVAVMEGLEPRLPTPSAAPRGPVGAGGGRFEGRREGGGGRPPFRREGGGGGRFEPRSEGRFEGRPQEGRFQGRPEGRPFEARPQEGRPFARPEGARFEPRGDSRGPVGETRFAPRGDAPRGPSDARPAPRREGGFGGPRDARGPSARPAFGNRPNKAR